jgi:hypothetical protein
MKEAAIVAYADIGGDESAMAPAMVLIQGHPQPWEDLFTSS